MIDRSVVVPLHYQLREQLRRRILAGEWGYDEPIPGEKDLCEQAAVSRSVVRQALGELVHEGILVRVQGRGTFVAQPKITEGLAAQESGFYEDMVSRGHEVTTRVISQGVVSAPADVAADLELPVGAPIVVLVRVRIVDGVPTVYVESRLPADRFGAIVDDDLTYESLYGVLERRFGARVGHSRRSLGAAAATKEIAAHLGIKPRDPLVVLESVGYSGIDGAPIESYLAYHRGDRTKFEVQLVRPADSGTISAPRTTMGSVVGT